MLNRASLAPVPVDPELGGAQNLGLNALLDAVFYRFGIWGIALSTSLVNIAGTGALLVLFRRRMRGSGSDTGRTFVPRDHRLGGARRGGVGTWRGLDAGLGQSLPAQIVSLGAGLVLRVRRASWECAVCSACASWRRWCRLRRTPRLTWQARQ